MTRTVNGHEIRALTNVVVKKLQKVPWTYQYIETPRLLQAQLKEMGFTIVADYEPETASSD